MGDYALKVLLTALVVVAVSEVSKRYSTLAVRFTILPRLSVRIG